MKRRIISIFLSVLILCTIVSCAASPSRSLTLESLEQYVLDQVLSFSALEHETNSWNETTEIKDYITLYAPDNTINGYIFHFETNGQDTGFMQISILNRDPHIVNLGFTGNDVLSSMVSHHNNLAVENSRSFEHITLSSSDPPKVYYTGGFNYYIESSANQLISLSRNEVVENDLSELLSEYNSYLLFYDGRCSSMTQKKLRLILISVIVTIGVLCAFTAGREVSLKPEHDTYPVGTTTVSATFRNAFPGQYHTGRKYVLEKFDGGTWVPIKKDAQGAFFEDDGFSPSFLTKITFDLTKYSDGLTEGQYRIRKTMYTKENTPFNIEFHFSVE